MIFNLRCSVLWISALICWSLMARPADAGELKVLTTTPDLAWIAEQLLGEDATVSALLSGQEDIHHVEAVPSFVLKAARTDVLCFLGKGLEIGWLPKVIEKSANASIQAQASGHCEVGQAIDALEVPKGKIDRSMGDVHPDGNPHYYLSLPKLADAATYMAGVFKLNLPPNQHAKLDERTETLRRRLEETHQSLQKKLQSRFPDGLPPLMQYHGNFSYFAASYGFGPIQNIEETPGVPPSAAQLVNASLAAKKQKAWLLLAVPYNPKNIIDKFSHLAGIPALVVPDVSRPKQSQYANPLLLQAYLVDRIIATPGS